MRSPPRHASLPMEFSYIEHKSHNADVNIEHAFQGELTVASAIYPLQKRMPRIKEISERFV